MPQPHTLRITEIFASVQGEGLRMGEPTLFIRLTGCNLRCLFCDTKYAWSGGREYQLRDILEKIRETRRKYPAEWVCLTGGEPFLQKIGGLVRMLRKEGLRVQVETNGTIQSRVRIDWLTLSPKPPEYYFWPEYTGKAKEVKLVVSRDLTLKTIGRIRKAFPGQTPLLLQPQSNLKWSFIKGKRLLHRSLNSGLANIRISLQLHKIMGLR